MTAVSQAYLLDGINEGDLCMVSYRSQSGNSQWYQWDCVAVFISRQPEDDHHYEDLTIWSLRPAAGTITVPTRSLMNIEVLKRHSERTDIREDRGARVPRRRKGTVPAP